MRIGILNATGYSGAELVRFLSGHPDFEISGVTARSQVGKRLGEIFPWVRAGGRPSYANLQLHEDLEETPDIVISCLPHKASAQRLAPFLDRGIRCIDVSADFRLRDPQMYARWHGVEHAVPAWLDSAVYGFPEMSRDRIRKCQLVAAEEHEQTGITAKQRLQLVLIQDRLDLPTEKMESMKQEILEVVSRYLQVADDFLEFEIRRLDELVVLVSNIQVNDATELVPAAG